MKNAHALTGELELTFLRSFCRGGNLKALLSREDMPNNLKDIMPIVEEHFGPQSQRTLTEDLFGVLGDPPLWDSKQAEVPLSDDVYSALLQRLNASGSSGRQSFRRYDQYRGRGHLLARLAQTRNKLTEGGVVYTSANSHRGDSLIMFTPFPGLKARAGQIKDIFVHQRRGLGDAVVDTEAFLVVQTFKALGQQEYDPYRPFPLLDVQLYYNDLSPGLTVIKPCDILSHVASCPYGLRKQVILSLSRVSIIFSARVSSFY
jgi:hypothetical protein